jgi:hypothetical protein
MCKTACRCSEAPSGVIVGNALMDMYAKCGEMDYALLPCSPTWRRGTYERIHTYSSGCCYSSEYAYREIK